MLGYENLTCTNTAYTSTNSTVEIKFNIDVSNQFLRLKCYNCLWFMAESF